MNDAELSLFHASLGRCTARPRFLETFYERFMASSPDVARRFTGTNWQRQYRMMIASFHMMVVAEEEGTAGNTHLERVAHLHGPAHHDIPAELYHLWLAALIEAVRDTDPQFNSEIEEAWRSVMRRGIDYMVRHGGSG